MYRTEFGNQEEDWDRSISKDERLRWIVPVDLQLWRELKRAKNPEKILTKKRAPSLS